MNDPRRFAPATERNREPILAVLARVLPPGARVLEIASGTGEHAAFLAQRLPIASWQPTDAGGGVLESIDAWRAHEGAEKVLPARPLDVESEVHAWPEADAIVCINMIHIAPWSATRALFEGASRILAEGAVLFLYGPYRRGGAHTAPSNEAFDASLRARDPRWGVRDLERVEEEAALASFRLVEVVEMPANNLSLVFRR